MKNFYFIHKKLWKVTGITSALLLTLTCTAHALEERNLAPSTAQTSSVAPSPSSSGEPQLADRAGDDFKGGAKSLGSGFKNGAKVTGRAFKKVGTTVGGAFKKAGSSIKTFFVGKKDSDVKESDLAPAAAGTQEGATEESRHYNRDLDRVGS